jgi:hypothetical protein
MEKWNIRDIIFTAILLVMGGVIAYLFFRRDVQILPVPSERVLERRIETEKREIPKYETIIQTDKKLVAELDKQLKDVFAELEKVKQSRDTFKIVETQDKTIGLLVNQSEVKDSIITNLERVTTIQKSVIQNQDTLILVQKANLKRVKRQRNISLAVNGMLATVLIIK